MTDALAVIANPQGMLDALVARRKMINDVMTRVMQKGVDYGTIPGCGDKPALFKPGAEKLCNTFGLAPEVRVTDLSTTDERRYQVTVRMLSNAGVFLGEGVGECSSNEEKYKWRGAFREEWDASAEDRRRVKLRKEKGKVEQTLQVRTNVADVANTVLKICKKRALIDAVLTATGTSDLLTQDIEEFNQSVTETAPPPPAPVVPRGPSATPPPAPGPQVYEMKPATNRAAEAKLKGADEKIADIMEGK